MHSVNWPPLNAAFTPTVTPEPIPPRAVLTVKPRTIHIRGPIEAIAAEEAERAGITLAQILGAQRSQKYVQPRHFAMWRASRETRASLSEIARAYDRDHTSVIHALRKVEERNPSQVINPSPQPSPALSDCAASARKAGEGEEESQALQPRVPLSLGEGRVRG
jgi:hypothetical protein